MARVYEYGIHEGIKYNKKRTLVRLCVVCKTFFIPIGKRDKVCSEECRKIMKSNNWSNWFNQLSDEYKRTHIKQFYFINNLKRQNDWFGYDVHHIIPKSTFPEFEFEEWNLIPVSIETHKTLHKKYGKNGYKKWFDILINEIGGI